MRNGATPTPSNDQVYICVLLLLYMSPTNKWIGGGAKLILAKTADADILRVIVIKLQQRVQVNTGNPIDQGEGASWLPTQ